MTIRYAGGTPVSAIQRINYLSPTTILCMEHDTTEDRVLHRGIFNSYTFLGQGTLGTSATYFGGGVYTMVNEVPWKQRWANWATNNGKTHDEIASLTNPCEYNDLLPRGLTMSSEPPAYPFVADYIPATPQDAKIVHKGDTYIMRHQAGLVYGTGDAGPENGHGAHYMLSNTSQFPNTPVDWASLFPNLLTDRVALYKFTRNGKISVPYDEQWLPSQMPPAFLAM
ncbi:hypothetical protein SPFM15_00133 [Salmonella phage SPFM15]|nr:hypothetical protein SPFM5_00128 [Salmonella phage SPFM5]VFR13757.1 hypothetical protein SPFM15_00133 [Salmonella phage SPFM15]